MDKEVMDRARQMAGVAGPRLESQSDIFVKQDVRPEPSGENPAVRPGKTSAERRRIPMSVPVQRLEVPAIPGYKLHWFRGTQDRISRAQSAGYEFVLPEEVNLNNVSLGSETAVSGNTDMGGRVSVVSGDEVDRTGQPMRLILMKQRLEFTREDDATREERSEQVAAALRGGKIALGQHGETPGDAAQRYVKQGENLFTRKTGRRPLV